MNPDSTLECLREARRQISEQCGHNPKRLLEHYLQFQEQFRDRLVQSTKSYPTRKTSQEKPKNTASS